MMESFWNIPFVVVDVETTGPSPADNRLIDIACVALMGGQVVAEYDSLVNPKQFIPPFIQQMTGITYDMVYDAPEAKVALRKASEFFENEKAVFVAHNAQFDYKFVNATLAREGLPQIINPALCTLKLARRLVSARQKKNLGDLSNYFNIRIKNRHRALGDAKAAALLLFELLKRAESEFNISSIDELLKFQNKPAKRYYASQTTIKRVQKKLDDLPNYSGVYRFLDSNGGVLYVGKAKSLRDRVRSYFYSSSIPSRKIARMLKEIWDIDWELTDSELSALLLESRKIKSEKPPYNAVSKKYRKHTFIKLTASEDFPRLESCFIIKNDGDEYFGPFSSRELVDEIIKKAEKIYKIRKCDKPVKPCDSNNPCLYYQIERCLSPCSKRSNREEYAAEVDKVRRFLDGRSGVAERLEKDMKEGANSLDFERAADAKNYLSELKKALISEGNGGASINERNFIVLAPSSSREKTIEIVMVKAGKIRHKSVIGRKAPLKGVFKKADDIYFNGDSKNIEPFEKEELDELKIVTSWVISKNERSRLFVNGKSQYEFTSELQKRIRKFSF